MKRSLRGGVGQTIWGMVWGVGQNDFLREGETFLTLRCTQGDRSLRGGVGQTMRGMVWEVGQKGFLRSGEARHALASTGVGFGGGEKCFFG